jgi:membrane protein involved in colicin uptake
LTSDNKSINQNTNKKYTHIDTTSQNILQQTKMPKSKGVNAKKAAGMALKAANKAEKDAAAAREREKQEAAEWKKGSNTKGAERAGLKAEKADEQARKKAEKAALLAAEEAEMGGGASASKARKATASGLKSKKKKPKDALSLLEDTLVGDADKKAKAKKKAARIKKEKEERLRKEREAKKDAESDIVQDPLMANTDSMLGNSLGVGGSGRLNASLVAGEVDASGIDSALSAMAVGNGKDDDHPEKRMKALHLAFEESMMPQMKQDYPGLKRSQYKEKIFAVWKKSPDNPMNWPKSQD